MVRPVLGRLPDAERRFALIEHTPDELSARLAKLTSYTFIMGNRPDQTTFGDCVGEAATAMMRAESVKHHPGGPLEMSVSAIYAQALRDNADGQPISDSGLPTAAGLQTYQKYGYVPDALRPYPASGDETSMLAPVDPSLWVPSFRERTISAVRPTVDAMRLALFTRGPLQIGLEWAEPWFTPDEHGVLPPATADANGGHSVVICEYDDIHESFIIANSWGTDWGIKPPGAATGGYAYLPYFYESKYPDFWVQDCYCVSM